MVEGAGYVRDDRICRRVRVFQNALRRNVHDAKAILRDEGIARCIALWPVGAAMRFAIDLGNRFEGRAVEIHNVRADRMLTAELEASLLAAQALPQERFGQAQIAAEFARGRDFRTEHLPHAPSTVR
ncbi:hypothetical protein GCM10011395_28650 [Sphingomonas psychrolutea]|uniref:Uncharacterized protein n=1 Tax=Sphingomonas psychrolutea TaxID=1259676 RepID=A0ABQ1H2I8_9SPHN|nr:hypothetical protein GCM10011395_28650 [Sphingomonas psychrolutea]